MRRWMLIVFFLFIFGCKPYGDKPEMSVFNTHATLAAVAAQKCMPPTSEQCGSVCYDPNRYCCCPNPNTGGTCLVAKTGIECECGDPPQCR